MRMSSGPCCGDRVGQRDDLRRVAQVDADDPQPVQPLGAVVHRREAPCGVAREARRDRRLGAVAQQPQRDVHADLRAAAGEQRATAAEVGAGVAALVMTRRAVGTELVVERVDDLVALLADVAGTRLDQRAGASPPATLERSGSPCVSSSMRPGAPVAVAATTAVSAACTASRRSARRRLRTSL